MSIDLIYLAYNRIEFTQFTFPIMVKNTDWELVNRLVVYDDGSEDGTSEWLGEQVSDWNNQIPTPADIHIHHTRFGSPVQTMNHYLDHYESDMFAKIDSDVATPPEWLHEMNKQMYLNPALDILGMQADSGPPALGRDNRRHTQDASHIGGVGLIRRRAFKFCRPVPRGRFGWTEFQQRHPEMTKAWIKPDLATFELDRLPKEPWISLSAKYVEEGWSRAWGPYAPGANDYWDWAFS